LQKTETKTDLASMFHRIPDLKCELKR